MLVTLAILGSLAVGLTYAVQSSSRVVPVAAMPASPAPPQTVIIKTEPLRVVVQAPAPVAAAPPASDPPPAAAASQPASAPAIAAASQPADSCGAGTKWDAKKKSCVRSCQAAASQPTKIAKASPCPVKCGRGTHCDAAKKVCVAACGGPKTASASQPAKKTKVAQGKPPATQPAHTKVAAAPKTKGRSPAPACTTGKCPKTPAPVDYTDATETYRATYR